MLPLQRRKIAVSLGNFIELAGTLFGLSLILLAPAMPLMFLSFLSYLIAWFCLEFFPHSLAHYVVGRLVGVRFRCYSLGRSSVFKVAPRFLSVFSSKSMILTLHVDQASLRSLSRLRRSMMFASGAVVSMLLPFLAAMASLGRIPWELSAVLLLISAANFVFDLFFSPKAGDLSRAIAAWQS